MSIASGRREQGPRLIAIVGPYQSGKTSLLEAMLHRCGVVSRQGTAADRSLAGDASAEARAHGMGVEANFASASYLGDMFHLADCPGSIEFSAEARAILPVCDAAIVVCDADEKKAPALQVILHDLDALQVPHLIFINKIDKLDGAPRDLLAWMQPLSAKPLVMRQLPIRTQGVVTGFVDLALERAHVYQEHAESRIIDMPGDVAALEKAERFTLLEALADHDDKMMELLLSDIEPSRDQIFTDLAQDVAEGHVVPVLFGSAEHGHGISRLLKSLRHDVRGLAATAERLGIAPDSGPVAQVIKTQHSMQGGKVSVVRVLAGEVVDGATLYDPAGRDSRVAGVSLLQGVVAAKASRAQPGDMALLGRLESAGTGDTLAGSKTGAPLLGVHKNGAHIYGMAISVVDRKDEVKLAGALARLVEEDGGLALEHDAEGGDMVLWGQGEMHLRIALERLAGKFGVKADVRPRRIAYRETIRGSTQVRGRHRKQSGGHGQYGDVVVEIAPASRGAGFVFSDTITGGVVPKTYIPAVEAGVREWMARGPLGFPMVDFSVNLSDGSYHDVDSSEMAFKQAARLAMVEGMPKCSPVLLEPILNVSIHVPSEATPRANQIVSGHRGQLLGFDGRAGWSGWDTIEAMLPEAEMASLIIELRSATSGVGTFESRFDHLAELTGRAADAVVAAARPLQAA